MGNAVDLQLETTQATSADDAAADAAAQRHRGLEHHEKDRMAAMPPTRPLTFQKIFCSSPHLLADLFSGTNALTGETTLILMNWLDSMLVDPAICVIGSA